MSNVRLVDARSALAVLTCSALLAGCSSGSNSRQRAVAPTAAPTREMAQPGEATTTTSTPARGSDGSSDEVSAVAARTALDTFLDAIAAGEYPTALSLSRDALRALAVVRSIVAAGNAERGGTTTSTYRRRWFEVALATPDMVRFRGDATLTSVVSGSGGPPVSTTATVSDVIVRRGADGWRVADASYNEAPILTFPATSTTTVGPIQIKLTGAIAFGGSLGVVVRLTATGDHSVDVADDALRINDEQARSTTRLVVGGQPGYIYLSYPRRDTRPTAWRATITVDGTSHSVSLDF